MIYINVFCFVRAAQMKDSRVLEILAEYGLKLKDLSDEVSNVVILLCVLVVFIDG